MKPTVLLIDDDQQLLDMYALKFSLDRSCTLLTASTPEKGIEVACAAKPSLILLDLVLPKHGGLASTLEKETGFGVLEHLKGDGATRDIPVVVFTNLDEQSGDNVDRAKRLGAIDYWVKAEHEPRWVLERVKGLVAG